MAEVRDRFAPEAIVVQCGADSLHGDPMQSFNLTVQGLGNCVSFILDWRLPTLLLGGGITFLNSANLKHSKLKLAYTVTHKYPIL